METKLPEPFKTPVPYQVTPLMVSENDVYRFSASIALPYRDFLQRRKFFEEQLFEWAHQVSIAIRRIASTAKSSIDLGRMRFTAMGLVVEVCSTMRSINLTPGKQRHNTDGVWILEISFLQQRGSDIPAVSDAKLFLWAPSHAYAPLAMNVFPICTPVMRSNHVINSMPGIPDESEVVCISVPVTEHSDTDEDTAITHHLRKEWIVTDFREAVERTVQGCTYTKSLTGPTRDSDGWLQLMQDMEEANEVFAKMEAANMRDRLLLSFSPPGEENPEFLGYSIHRLFYTSSATEVTAPYRFRNMNSELFQTRMRQYVERSGHEMRLQ